MNTAGSSSDTKADRRRAESAKYTTSATASATYPPRENVKKNVRSRRAAALAARPRTQGGLPLREAVTRNTGSAITMSAARTFQYPSGALRRANSWAYATTSGATLPKKA